MLFKKNKNKKTSTTRATKNKPKPFVLFLIFTNTKVFQMKLQNTQAEKIKK